MSSIIANRIRTPDGTILESHHRHDYKTYVDENGETYMVDGGLAYLRRNVNKQPYEELSVYVEDGHEKIRENMSWGSYGPNGDQPLKRILLKDLTTDHINAIIETQTHLPKERIDIFKEELKYRGASD